MTHNPFRRLLSNIVTHDYLAMAVHITLLTRAWLAPQGPNASLARSVTAFVFAIAFIILLLTRGEVLPQGGLRAILYRLGLFTPLFISYFELKSLLPALRPQLLDSALYELDTALFGLSPAVGLDDFVRFETVEWFAFFYYTYFALMLVYLFGSLFIDQGRRVSEVMLGAAIVVCVGHFAYTLVPGFGPHIAITFIHERVGGFWWRTVDDAVKSGGAHLDIFPSLHTAYPSLFTLHALRHRDKVPFKYGWHITVFWLANILIATVFLRWHWAIDLMGGMTLAIVAHRIGIVVGGWETARDREAEGLQPIWEPIRAESS